MSKDIPKYCLDRKNFEELYYYNNNKYINNISPSNMLDICLSDDNKEENNDSLFSIFQNIHFNKESNKKNLSENLLFSSILEKNPDLY